MPKYTVRVSGMVECNEWYNVIAENAYDAEEKAIEQAEDEGLEDPQVCGTPRLKEA